MIPWWCVGQYNLSFPVSPFNVVFKAVRREGLDAALLQDLGFSYPLRLLVSNGVGFACLHRAVEKGPCKRLICAEGLQPSTRTQIGHLWAALVVNVFSPAGSTAKFISLVIAPTC